MDYMSITCGPVQHIFHQCSCEFSKTKAQAHMVCAPTRYINMPKFPRCTSYTNLNWQTSFLFSICNELNQTQQHWQCQRFAHKEMQQCPTTADGCWPHVNAHDVVIPNYAQHTWVVMPFMLL